MFFFKVAAASRALGMNVYFLGFLFFIDVHLLCAFYIRSILMLYW